jgi:RNA polymerase sigma-70 factor (ECF subfamily)
MPLLPDTRRSLIARLADSADADAWSEFVDVYEEAVYRFSRGRGLQEADARDAVQRVWVAVHGAMADWKPTGRSGSFRTWLVRTAHRTCMRVLRENRGVCRGAGGTSVLARLNAVADVREPESEESTWQRWAFCWAAGQVEREVEAVTWQCFHLAAVQGASPADVASRLNVRVGTVYASKCRVLARIRQRVRELSEERQ